MTTLEGALAADGYLLGDSCTAADLYPGSQLGWGMMARNASVQASVAASR